jgi:hypothetical protein
MSRIRTIKPEFVQSESTGNLSRDARLLFILIWTIADDVGRTRAASRMLASVLYPYDDDVPDLIDGWLDELEQRACIRRYDVNGARYLEVVNWLKHQKIDHPSPSRLPAFSAGLAKVREASRSLAPDLDLGPGPGPQDSRSVAVATRPPDEIFEAFWSAYPKREGSNPRKPARTKFLSLCREGADPLAIIAGVKRYAEQEAKNVGTPYIKRAVHWLNQWSPEDDAPSPALTAAKSAKFFVHLGTPEWTAWDKFFRATKGVGPPQTDIRWPDQDSPLRRGYMFDSQYPPNQKQTNVPLPNERTSDGVIQSSHADRQPGTGP